MAASWRRTACQARKNPRSLTDTRMQLKYLAVTMTFQRTVTTPLTLCLNSGVHPKPHLLIFPCCFPHARQPLCHVLPALSRVRVRLTGVLLDQRPSLPALRRRCFVVVRVVHRYYSAV